MQDDALQLDNRDGRNLGQLEIAQIQPDRFETDSKTFQAYEKILHKLYDYEKVSLEFLLGDERRSPPTDLLKEALAISGNFDAIRKVFKQDKNDEALQHFQAQNPNHSVKVNLLRKKLFILAEKLTPSETQEVIYSLADGNFGPVDQKIELYFESLIKSDKLSLYHSEKLRKVLLDLKLTDLYKIFSGNFICLNNMVKLLKIIIADSSVRDDQLYKINPNNVGTCIIINQKLYKEGLDLKSRLGTDLDCSRLEETFTLFGYKVNVFHNVKFSKMAPTLKEVRDNIEDQNSSEDKCSSLIVCILAHGRKGATKIQLKKCLLMIKNIRRRNHLS
jgi:hypothetical protein